MAAIGSVTRKSTDGVGRNTRNIGGCHGSVCKISHESELVAVAFQHPYDPLKHANSVTAIPQMRISFPALYAVGDFRGIQIVGMKIARDDVWKRQEQIAN